jgi:integrase
MVAYVVKGRKRQNGKRGPYRGRYRVGNSGPLVEVALGTTDKQVAERLLRQTVKEAEQEAAGLIAPRAERDAAGKAYLTHADDFLADLEARGRGDHYVVNVRGFLTRLGDECGWRLLNDVDVASFEAWRARQSNKSPKTLNEYLNAIRNLLNWLAARDRIKGNPLQAVSKVETKGRETRTRRALTDTESGQLLAVAGSRMPVYLVALNTGLRRGEIRALQWGDVVLDGRVPRIVARASTTKNSKQALVALKPEVAAVLAELKPGNANGGDPVFKTVPRARELRQDLARAGIPYQDDQGRYADFHAFRHTFITNLGRTGAPERVRMEAARHSDPRLTANVYTDTSQLPTSAAIMNLPNLLGAEFGSHIGSHELDTERHSASLVGTERQAGAESQPAENKEKGHDLAQNGTSCPLERNGSGGWIRTSDQVVNSHLLYR